MACLFCCFFFWWVWYSVPMGLGSNLKIYKWRKPLAQFAWPLFCFSGGLDTRISEIKPVIGPGVVLATLGVLLTAIFTGLFTYWMTDKFFPALGLGLLSCMLLASTVSSTDSASVFAILRSKGLTLKNNLRPLLELESGSNDPMAYLLTVMFIDIIQYGDNPNYLVVGLNVVIQLVVGTGMGILLGRLAVKIFNKVKMDNDSFYPIMLLVFGVFIFSITYFLKGNGYLAVYIAGLTIGNSRFVHKRSSMRFMDGFAWMSQILLFLTLGLLVNPSELVEVIVPALIISFFMIVFARPITVFLCLAPFRKVGFKDKLYISWVGLRGAVPIIFAILPLAAGVPGARLIFNIVFVLTLVSLLMQGTTLPFVARMFGLAEKPKIYKPFQDFDVDFAEEIKSVMTEILITEETLKYGKNLMEIQLPDKTLAVMVKRENNYFVPTGQTELHPNDILLVISDDEKALKEAYKNIGISDFTYRKNQ